MKFTFSGAQSGNVSAVGLRAIANIQAYPDRAGTIAQVKIWGLTMAQMNAYSSTIPLGVGAQNYNCVIEAGDLGSPLVEVLNGPIYRSFIDLSGAPESVFDLTSIDTFTAATPIAAQSLPGAQSAATMIANICAAAGLTFNNSAGASGVLTNQSTSGSAIDQIARIATAAKFNWKLSGTKLSIWPKGGAVDSTVIQVGPTTDPQMVNYPVYWEGGIIVTSLYNPQVQIGRQMQVVGSLIPKANGLWNIVSVQHDLSTMLSKGPWFTTAILAAGNP